MARTLAPILPAAAGTSYWSAAPSPVPTRPPASDMAGTSSLAPDSTAAAADVQPVRLPRPPPDVAAGEDAGLTPRELLMEMRQDIKALEATVDAIARDQAAGVERRRAHCHCVRPQPLGQVRETGRGERHCPATTDLPVTMRLAEPPEPCEWLRSA